MTKEEGYLLLLLAAGLFVAFDLLRPKRKPQSTSPIEGGPLTVLGSTDDPDASARLHPGRLLPAPDAPGR